MLKINLEKHLNFDNKIYIAFSGGSDSSALLYLISDLRDRYEFNLEAIHINHNLSHDSKKWEDHCKTICKNLSVPIIVVITGEGGSGGALAISVGDHLSMLEYATYSVASPEACASIIWRTAEKAPDAADAMKVSSSELKKINIVDEIISEPLGGAHRDYDLISQSIKDSIVSSLSKLSSLSSDDLVKRRYERLLAIGS